MNNLLGSHSWELPLLRTRRLRHCFLSRGMESRLSTFLHFFALPQPRPHPALLCTCSVPP